MSEAAKSATIAAVYGPAIFARTLNVARKTGKSRALWQYHGRGDRHSQVACWCILFDLMLHSPVLVGHVRAGRVAFGINHEMNDFRNLRKKLDLVVCTPAGDQPQGKQSKTAVRSFRDFVPKYEIVLTDAEQRALDGLPDVPHRAVGAVHVALEAKATMTEHIGALPRLYDELDSSHMTIHGATDVAIAVGFVMVNMADKFVSPGRRPDEGATRHSQPADTEAVIQKVRELNRRSKIGEAGFDAVGIVVIDCVNDGSPVTLIERPPAPDATDTFNYGRMVERVAHLYAARFATL